MNEWGAKFPLKIVDTYIEEFIKAVRNFSRFGQDCYEEALELSVAKRDIKYLALFVRSINSETTAQILLEKVFAESSLWDRDASFFYILNVLTDKFPNLPIQHHYQTLFQEIIKVITCVIDPATEEDIKRLINEDPYIGVNCILRSVAQILVNLLRPTHEAGWQSVWSCV